jgi:hypothetical protein
MGLGGGVVPRHAGSAPMKLPKANGSFPTFTFATTVFVEVSITETVLSPLLATYVVFRIVGAGRHCRYLS